MDKAGLKYTDEGVEIVPPERPGVEIRPPWRPKVGEDARDLRDPQKIGRRILARVRRRKGA